jgi:hypothetical protein
MYHANGIKTCVATLTSKCIPEHKNIIGDKLRHFIKTELSSARRYKTPEHVCIHKQSFKI